MIPMKVECLIQHGLAIPQMPFEIVEIKGRGHPDPLAYQPITRLASGSPLSNFVMLSIVVVAMFSSASRVKNAW
jgi:hypothetical protein